MKLSEDWWSLSLGATALIIASTRIITWLPKINKWSINPSEALKNTEIPLFIILAFFLLALTSIAIFGMKENLKKYSIGFLLIFILSFFGRLLSNQELIHKWGIEYVIWALILGLLISNTLGTPEWLKPAIKTELFIKIGLVILGAEILFQTILAAGTRGMIQAIIVVPVVWCFSYFLGTKLGLTKSFSAIMASGVSICGVSAAIAAGGAIKGDKKEVSYTISMILLVAIPMVIFMPLAAKLMSLPDAVAGAWIGGTIDTTPAVVAAGALYSNKAMAIASIVKMSQNVLIGVVAFILALYWTFEKSFNKKPSLIEIWYRFPKFILGFIVASIFFSLILTPAIGKELVASITNVTKELRAWFFTMAFVCIGLDTKFSELIKIGRGKPLYIFLMAQAFNIVFTLIVAYILFGL
ncbi:MAG: putative sulfate exporter family transporter [Candidatus Bathyarchaeia archaeon]|nr:putative sulfate exporter family transporter [Candidatus Bathyarchaeota archaeon]